MSWTLQSSCPWTGQSWTSRSWTLSRPIISTGHTHMTQWFEFFLILYVSATRSQDVNGNRNQSPQASPYLILESNSGLKHITILFLKFNFSVT